MKTRTIITLILCALLICATLFGCDNGEVIDGNLVIELDGNPTTGYTWVYQMSSEGIIEEVSNTYAVASGTDGLVGAGGTFRFEFAPVAPGKVGLQFSYLRTFQENSTIEVRNYAVTVDENLQITFYSEEDDSVSSTDTTGIIAGSTYVDTVVFGETTEDVVFTWTLCNAGIYVGVDTEYIQWYYADGVDTFAPVEPSDEPQVIGTKMTVVRHKDTNQSAAKYAQKFMEESDIFSDFSKFDTEIGGLAATGIACSNPDIGISATYYFIQVDNDVVEIAAFYEGANADDLGPRLDAMAKSITFTDNVGIIE